MERPGEDAGRLSAARSHSGTENRREAYCRSGSPPPAGGTGCDHDRGMIMKTTTVLAIALGLGALGACNKSPRSRPPTISRRMPRIPPTPWKRMSTMPRTRCRPIPRTPPTPSATRARTGRRGPQRRRRRRQQRPLTEQTGPPARRRPGSKGAPARGRPFFRVAPGRGEREPLALEPTCEEDEPCDADQGGDRNQQNSGLGRSDRKRAAAGNDGSLTAARTGPGLRSERCRQSQQHQREEGRGVVRAAWPDRRW